MRHGMFRFAACALYLSSAACLGPLVDSDPGSSLNILPPGAAVPLVSENSVVLGQIRANDGLANDLPTQKDPVKLNIGYAGGQQVLYWNFGRTQPKPSRVYYFGRRTGPGVAEPLDPDIPAAGGDPKTKHPLLFDVLPGEPGYSGFWHVHSVLVTARYQGERIASSEALQDAIEIGLVEAPDPRPTWVTAPIVPPDTKLEVVQGGATEAPMKAYANGYVIDFFLLAKAAGPQPMVGNRLPEGDAFQLYFKDELEPMPKLIFQNYSTPYTPLVRQYNARLTHVSTPPPNITFDNETQLLERDAAHAIVRLNTNNVATLEETMTWWNWPMQLQGGMP